MTLMVGVDVNLKPVAVTFEMFRDIERLSQKGMDDIDATTYRAVGYVQHEDGDVIRLVYRIEGMGHRGKVGPEFSSITIPKDSIIDVGLPFDAEVIDYWDHVSYGYTKDVTHAVPLKCTVYGRIQEETKDYIRLVHFEKGIESEEPKYDGIVILKSCIFNRETFKEEPEPEEQEPLQVHV